MTELKKKDFKFDERVRLINTGTELDGKEASVWGKAMVHVIDSYIIVFDRPVRIEGQEPYRAIVMVEGCLEKVG